MPLEKAALKDDRWASQSAGALQRWPGDTELGSTVLESRWPFSNSSAVGGDANWTSTSGSAARFDGADTLDDICEQIRQLRGQILPPGSAGHSQNQPFVPAVSSTASPRGGDVAAGGAVRSGASSGTGHMFSPPPRRSPRSPLRLRHTLWEERQLERCLHGWRCVCELRSGDDGAKAQSPPQIASPVPDFGHADQHPSEDCGTGGFDRELPPELTVADGIRASPAASRVDLCFRVWRRLCAANRAAEIATSVRVLDAQVSRQLRHAVMRWFGKAQRRRDKRSQMNLRVTTRRIALRWWRRAARDAAEMRSTHREVYKGQRLCAVQRAVRLWVSRSASSLRWRSYRSRQKLRYLRLAMQLWLLAREYTRQKLGAEQANALILRANAVSRILRWWTARARAASQFQQLQLQAARQLQLSAKCRAWNRLVGQSRRAQRSVSVCKTVAMKLDYRRQRQAMQTWSRWYLRRVERLRLLTRHQTTKVNPRILRRVLQSWLSLVRRKQRHDVALQKARIVMALSIKNRTFISWLGVTKSIARALAMMRSVAVALHHDAFKVSFDSWRGTVAAARRLREQQAAAQTHDDRRILSGCFQTLREHAITSKRFGQLLQVAFAHSARAIGLQFVWRWRRFLERQRWEAEQLRRGFQRHAAGNVRTHFNLWRTSAVELRHERLLTANAEQKRFRVLLARATARWVGYLVHRRHKLHEAAHRQCLCALATLKRRRVLGCWAQVQRARAHAVHVAFATHRRIARALFVWGRSVLDERRRANLVIAVMNCGLKARTLTRFRTLFRAMQLQRGSRNRNLVAWTWGLWRLVWQADADTAAQRIREGLLLQRFRLLRLGMSALWGEMLERRQLRSRMLVLVGALESVAHYFHDQSKAWSIDSWCEFVDDCRAVDAAQLEYNLMQQQQLCFQHWVQFCQHQAHKRSVHAVCGQYRDRRLLRSAMQCWRIAHIHLCDTADAVLMLAASLATQNATEIFVAWHAHAARMLHARWASQALQARRRAFAWARWHDSFRKAIDARRKLTAATANRQCGWLRAWLSFARFKGGQRRRYAIATHAVRSSRQRHWIDRWCEVGRWQRLSGVAEAWDQQVMSRQVLKAVVTAWSDVIYLSAKAQDCVARVNQLRTRAHLRMWNDLKRVLGVRPRRAAKQGLLLWRAVCEQIAQCRHQIRCKRLRAGFQPLRSYQLERKRIRESIGQRHQAVESCLVRRNKTHAIRSWRKWASEVKKSQLREQPQEFRKKKLARHAKRCLSQLHAWATKRRTRGQVMEDLTKKGRLCCAARLKRAIAEWTDAALIQKAINFRRKHDRSLLDEYRRDGEDAKNEPSVWRMIFMHWSAHTKRRVNLKATQQVVWQNHVQSARSRVFDLWAKVYEYQSSSFYAGQILIRTKLGRLLAAWFRITNFRKRFTMHVSHLQVLQDTQLLRYCFRLWDQNLHEHRCIAAVWLERWRHWSLALVTGWRRVVQERQMMRQSLQHMRTVALSLKNRRQAELLRLSHLSTLLRVCFAAFASWVRKSRILHARRVDLQQRVTAERQFRRLCSWSICARAQERSANPCGGMHRVFTAWVEAHRLELSQARGVIGLISRQNSVLLVQILRPWLEFAWGGREDRRAYRQFQVNLAVRRRLHGLAKWRSWVRARCGCRIAVHSHRAHRNTQAARRCVRAWQREARCCGICDSVTKNRKLSSLVTHFRAWSAYVANWVSKLNCGRALRNLTDLGLARESLALWARVASQQAGARRLVNTLDRAKRKWCREEEWRAGASRDTVLQSMFKQFVSSFVQQRAGWSCEDSGHPERDAFQAVLSLIWERQQLSVALGRLRGRAQPWVLGAWQSGPTPLLRADSPFIRQAEVRLATMMARLEAARANDHAVVAYCRYFSNGCDNFGRRLQPSETPELQQRVCMWQALADLMVVYRPQWSRSGDSPGFQLTREPRAASEGVSSTAGGHRSSSSSWSSQQLSVAPARRMPQEGQYHYEQRQRHDNQRVLPLPSRQSELGDGHAQVLGIMQPRNQAINLGSQHSPALLPQAAAAPGATPVFGFRATSNAREPFTCGAAGEPPPCGVAGRWHLVGGIVSAT